MNTFSTSDHNLDEIVFEHRNKSYGAYALRRDYSSNLLKGFLGTLLLMLFLLCANSLLRLFIPVKQTIPAAELTTPFNPMDDFVIEIRKPLTCGGVPVTTLQPRNAPPVIVRDADIKDPVPDNHTDPPPVPGTDTRPANGNGTPAAGNGPGTPAGGNPAVTLPVAIDAPKDYTENMPEYPGGTGSMKNFLNNVIEYPEQARTFDVQGKVIVSFIIETDGSVTNIEVIRGKGYGLDEEAKRVVALMPKWKPGTNANGEKVRVKCNLPIVFTRQ